MKKIILRTLALTLACVLCLLSVVSCGNKSGETLLTLEKDGISVSISVNIYELMLSRMKGTLAFYGYTANGVTAEYDAFWDYLSKFNGTDIQTADEYYRASILNNCRNYLVALYLFEKEGLTLSATAEEKIEDMLEELIRTDGNGSKTKLNAVLATYGVNYDILKEAYTIEAKVEAVQDHLYGQDGSAIGKDIKDDYLEENYVHFRQIFLATYSYVYETDGNGDTIYFYTEGDNKGHIYYDTSNGIPGVTLDKDGNASAIKDENGDRIYFTKDGTYETVTEDDGTVCRVIIDKKDLPGIVYNKTYGEPEHVLTDDNTEYETEDMTAEELQKVEDRANELFEQVKDLTAAEFEAVMKNNSEDMENDSTEYNDGYYLQTNIDYTASGDDYLYLEQIVSALKTMEVGDVVLVPSNFGYHVVRKYEHTENAYDKEENQTWFEDFTSDLIEMLFLEKCQSYYANIQTVEAVLAEAPDMKKVGVNYYY